MPEAIRLEHVGIPTSEETFDATIAFYTELFGWRVIRRPRPATPGERIIFVGDGQGGAFEVFASSGRPLAEPAHLAFAVPIAEFAALEARLRAARVAFDNEHVNPA